MFLRRNLSGYLSDRDFPHRSNGDGTLRLSIIWAGDSGGGFIAIGAGVLSEKGDVVSELQPFQIQKFQGCFSLRKLRRLFRSDDAGSR